MGTEVQSIPKIRQVYYDVYADLPTVGVATGDLGYATDRLILYRWNGAAWQAITIHSSSGTAGAIPAAANLPNGSIYFETDTGLLKQVQGGAWVNIITLTRTIGTYTGDSSANRAIPHGIGAVPSLVLIFDNTSGYDAVNYNIGASTGRIASRSTTSVFGYNVTLQSTTNFYVGNATNYTQSMNVTGNSYRWVAWS
jgi:hypothetical protein